MVPSESSRSPGDVPPTGDPLTRVTAYAQAVAGRLRPLSVLDQLLAEVKASFAPEATAAIAVDEQGRQASASGADDDPALLGILRDALAGGATIRRPMAGGEALAAPLRGRRGLTGAIVLRRHRPLEATETALFDALLAVTAVALDGAGLLALAESRHGAWNDALAVVGLPLLIVDPTGRIECANPAAAALLGVPAATLPGRAWADVLPVTWHQSIRTLLDSAEPVEVEVSHGGLTLSLSAARTATVPVRSVLLWLDQTNRHRLQERLVHSEKLTAIGQLVAAVAHDLNNPLTSVVGFADFLAESVDVPARLREPLRVIQQEAERASKIVKNLLSFARRQEARHPTDLRPILEATVSLLQSQVGVDRVTLGLELAPDLPLLDLNPNQIQQVFVNLIQNGAQALAASGRPGSVRMRARRWMDGVSVEVVDDGPGMTPDVAARVFEPFFTTRTERGGTGLGLSISQGIVKEHGGRITLTTAPGAGATFTVELPGRIAQPLPPPVPVEPAQHRALTVLVVDDEPHILHYIRATLESWGHRVETASDGQVALERAIHGDFDLIISDLRMPRLGGRELFETLRDRYPTIAARVAFSTGDTVRGDTLAFLESQGRPCLQKPFSLAELRGLLRQSAAS